MSVVSSTEVNGTSFVCWDQEALQNLGGSPGVLEALTGKQTTKVYLPDECDLLTECFSPEDIREALRAASKI